MSSCGMSSKMFGSSVIIHQKKNKILLPFKMAKQVITYGKQKYRNMTGDKVPPRGSAGRSDIIQQKISNQELVPVGQIKRKGHPNPHKGMKCTNWVPKNTNVKADKPKETELNVAKTKKDQEMATGKRKQDQELIQKIHDNLRKDIKLLEEISAKPNKPKIGKEDQFKELTGRISIQTKRREHLRDKYYQRYKTHYIPKLKK